MSFACCARSTTAKAGFDPLQADRDHAARRGHATPSCSSSSRAGSGTRPARGASNGSTLRRHRLPEHVGRHARRSRRHRDPRRLHRRQRRRSRCGRRRRTPTAARTGRSRPTRTRSSTRSSRSSRASRRSWNGKATLSTPFARPEPALLVLLLEGRASTHASAATKACGQGNIHFAGEHCSQDFQGYMEGGASEGRPRRQRDPGRPQTSLVRQSCPASTLGACSAAFSLQQSSFSRSS